MRRNYEDDTHIDWEDGPFACRFVKARAKCADGKLRNAHPTYDGIADTFFSIPAYVYVQGKRVYGYLGIDSSFVYFSAYTYRKHHDLIVKARNND